MVHDYCKILFGVAEKCIGILDETSPLSHSGKYEVLLLNSSYILSTFSQSNPSNTEEVINGYFTLLENFASQEGHDRSMQDIVNFNNQRITFYTGELNNLFNREGYIIGKMYNQIYENPLATSNEMSYDMSNILILGLGLNSMLDAIDSILTRK